MVGVGAQVVVSLLCECSAVKIFITGGACIDASML